MYRNVLQSIQDIQTWPVIGLVIFFAFFTGILIVVLKSDRKLMEKLKNLPFADEKEIHQNENQPEA